MATRDQSAGHVAQASPCGSSNRFGIEAMVSVHLLQKLVFLGLPNGPIH
jgi:hypothetical protein